MATLNSSTNRSINKHRMAVVELSRRSERVSEALDVVDSLVEQANMMALDAAIEAIQAGRQGRRTSAPLPA